MERLSASSVTVESHDEPSTSRVNRESSRTADLPTRATGAGGRVKDTVEGEVVAFKSFRRAITSLSCAIQREREIGIIHSHLEKGYICTAEFIVEKREKSEDSREISDYLSKRGNLHAGIPTDFGEFRGDGFCRRGGSDRREGNRKETRDRGGKPTTTDEQCNRWLPFGILEADGP